MRLTVFDLGEGLIKTRGGCYNFCGGGLLLRLWAKGVCGLRELSGSGLVWK